MGEILPQANNIVIRYLSSADSADEIKLLTVDYPNLVRELRSKEEKVLFECQTCKSSLLGVSEKTKHFKSSKHKSKLKKLKRDSDKLKWIAS